MEIKICDGSIETSKAQHDYVMNKVGVSASRLNDTDSTIEVRLSDLNGIKGGIDKECSILVISPGLSTLRVEEQATDYYGAIDAAAATLKKSLAKSLEKTKHNGPR